MPRSRKSGGRKSTLESPVGPEQMKDSRSQRDDDCLLQRMKKLHEVLLGLGFPGSITVENLQSTSLDDFRKALEFIPCFSEASYQIHTTEVEEEIPKFLKDLRYPAALSNSSVYFVGNCPDFLRILWLKWIQDWLRNCLIVKVMCLKKKKLLFPCGVEAGAEFKKVFMENCCDAYRKFMEGDPIKEEDEVIFNMLLKPFTVNKQEFFSQQEMNRKIMEQVEIMDRECQKLTPADVEQQNREREELKQSLLRGLEEIKQLIGSNSDSDTELGGNGAAGVEQRGANTQKSPRVKKVRRRQRKGSPGLKRNYFYLLFLVFTLFVCFIVF